MTIRKLPATPLSASDRDPHRGESGRAARRIVERVLRTVSYLASALVIIGFVAFAYDQIWIVSDNARTEIANSALPDPSPAGEHARELKHGPVREAIDDANDALLKPFANIDPTTAPWQRRLVPALLALLVYGFGLGYLASFARGRFPH